jgi:hypothetical protein
MQMSFLDELRSRVDWEKIIQGIADIMGKAFGLSFIIHFGPYIIPHSISYANSILSGDIITILSLVFGTPFVLRVSKWRFDNDEIVAKSINYAMYGVAFSQSALVVLTGAFLVVRFGFVASLLVGSLIAMACTFIFDPDVFSEYLLKPIVTADVEQEPLMGDIIDESEFAHYLTLDDLEYRDGS